MPVPPAVIDAIGELLPPLLGTLERVEWVQRHLYPPLAGQLADDLAPCTDAVVAPLRALEGLAWPEEFQLVRDRLADVGQQTLELVTAFVDAARLPDEPIGLYRALRRFARVQEALYPLAPIYLIHGALDWMFPVHTTRVAREALLSAGAQLVYREIEDLSHTYPRDENPKILDWLMAEPTA